MLIHTAAATAAAAGGGGGGGGGERGDTEVECATHRGCPPTLPSHAHTHTNTHSSADVVAHEHTQTHTHTHERAVATRPSTARVERPLQHPLQHPLHHQQHEKVHTCVIAKEPAVSAKEPSKSAKVAVLSAIAPDICTLTRLQYPLQHWHYETLNILQTLLVFTTCHYNLSLQNVFTTCNTW